MASKLKQNSEGKELALVEHSAGLNDSKLLICRVGHYESEEEEKRINRFYVTQGWVISEPDVRLYTLGIKKLSG